MVAPSAIVILCCSLSLTLVEGFYTLQAQLHGYDNPNQVRVTGCNNNGCSTACCDNTGTCTSGFRRCDTFFIFCLRPFESGAPFGCGSSSGSEMQSTVSINGATIDFSQSTFLGLHNPLVFQGLTNAWNGIQVYIEIRDSDNSGSQLIDIILINIPAPSLGTPTGIVKHQGLVEIAEIEVNISVLCVPNFQGSNCTECISGFTGILCNEIDDCVDVTCSGRGQCVDEFGSYSCNCDPGFTGTECEDNINECIDPGVTYCSGNGQCVDEFGSYSCNCSAGYSGTNCEININDCLTNPCGTNGQCVDRINSFTCICNTGYTGSLCERDIDECQSNPCGTNGQCENQEGTFNCSCDPGFTGELCQIDINDCVGVNCSGNGECRDGVDSFTCICNTGYTGILCDSDIDECQSNPCGTNGQCVDGVDTFNCSCDPGFTGERCRTNIDDCVEVNCSGNGECFDGVNSFTCQCSPGHGGTLCAEEIRSSGIGTGPIVGGVLGVLISLILILAIVVAVVLIMRCQNRQGKGTLQAVKIQGGKPFIVPIVSGAVGGALISIIVLVLVTLLIINIRRKIRHSSQEVKPNIDITLSDNIKMEKNEVYGISMATVLGQPPLEDNTLMSENVLLCYNARY